MLAIRRKLCYNHARTKKRHNMLPAVIISAVTCLIMILSVLFFPKLKLGKLTLSTYWIVTVAGAVVLLLFGGTDLPALGRALLSDTAVNPLKILVLFLSMTVLSVFLDELGFFRSLAGVALRHTHGGQKRLFLSLYIMVSALTVFTSNDVIILSFTPFLCYFAKNAKIDPMPYLAAEFVAANTWSMALVIGNPTNIYLATAYGIDFLTYLKYSAVPTLFAGPVAFFALYLLFRKKLSAPVEHTVERAAIEDKFLLWVGIAHLAICTVLLAVSSYIGLEMWIVSLSAAGSLAVFVLLSSAIRKKKPVALGRCLKRAPYPLVPFVLSMFVLIVTLEQKGVTAAIGRFLGDDLAVLKYGTLSFLAANIVNNIPMSVLFSSVLQTGGGLGGMLATVIGSNVGAFLTPIGALAGIMFSSIVSSHGVKFGYLDFLKIGVAVAIPTLFAALGGLLLVV